MELICCTNIQGNPRHRIETCFARKEKAKVLSKKESSAGWKHGTTGVTGDYFYNVCHDCDPKKMKTVKINTSQFTAPIMTKKLKKETVMVKKKESKPTHKPKHVCQCGVSTDDPAKFIIEQGICRKCYMKEYYRKNSRKKAVEAVKERTTGEGVLGKPKREETTVKAPENTTGTPVCRVCGIKSTEALVFSLDKNLCGECECKLHPDYRKTTSGPSVDDVLGVTVKGCGNGKLNVGTGADGEGQIVFDAVPTDSAVITTDYGYHTLLKEGYRRATPRYKVLLDFTDHPELLEFLEKEAKKDFRTPRAEILAFVKFVSEISERAVKNGE